MFYGLRCRSKMKNDKYHFMLLQTETVVQYCTVQYTRLMNSSSLIDPMTSSH